MEPPDDSSVSSPVTMPLTLSGGQPPAGGFALEKKVSAAKPYDEIREPVPDVARDVDGGPHGPETCNDFGLVGVDGTVHGTLRKIARSLSYRSFLKK